jgi:hypothetical protein
MPRPGIIGLVTRWRFEGEIAAFGTSAGHRIVLGRWPVSPFGPISDVMLETPDGMRLLIAPSDEVADFIASTYRFDSVDVTPVEMIRRPGRLQVAAGQLRADLSIGRRGWLGVLLRAVPRAVATAPSWATLIDPLVRTALPGVRTRGSAESGRGTEPEISTHWSPSPLAGRARTSEPWPTSVRRSGSASAPHLASPPLCTSPRQSNCDLINRDMETYRGCGSGTDTPGRRMSTAARCPA